MSTNRILKQSEIRRNMILKRYLKYQDKLTKLAQQSKINKQFLKIKSIQNQQVKQMLSVIFSKMILRAIGIIMVQKPQKYLKRQNLMISKSSLMRLIKSQEKFKIYLLIKMIKKMLQFLIPDVIFIILLPFIYYLNMFPDNDQNQPEQENAELWYKYQEAQIEAKFKALNTDALEEIRTKLRKKQTKNENQENIELLEQQRIKIIEKMKEHVEQCEHPNCAVVKQIIMCYQLHQIKNKSIEELKKDNVVLIVRYGTCTGYTQTNCPVGSTFNKKMIETHRIFKGM